MVQTQTRSTVVQTDDIEVPATTTVVAESDEMNTLYQVLYYFLGFINVMLILRLIFKAFGANPRSGIVQIIYTLTDVMLLPFTGIFDVAAAGEFVVEPSILVAIVLYSLLIRGIVELIRILTRSDTRRVE